MRLVHLADLHLGYRQYTRTTPAGVNQREVDVAETFRIAVDRIIALAPDLIVIGGDIFHVVRPSNSALLHAFTEFSRLARSLPGTRIVLVAGNHDTPRSTDAAGILQLFAPLGIHVVDRGVKRIAFPDLDLSVLAVPDVPGLMRPPLEPDPSARFNVMVLHGEVEGMMSAGKSAGRPVVEIPRDDVQAPRWDYVALGHWHVYRELAPNMFYSGSIDYTSSNPWGELADERRAGLAGKGFAERDLVTGEQTFHPLPASRRLVDVPTFTASGMSAGELNVALRAALDAAGIDDAVARVVVTEVPKDVARALDQKAIREFKRRALNLNLDLRRPELVRVMAPVPGRRQRTLDDLVRDFLGERVHANDFTDIMALAEQYLGQTKDPSENDTSLAEMLEQSLAAKVA